MFHTLTAPTATDAEDVARRTAERVAALLVRHGRSSEGDGEDPRADQPAPASLATASARGLDVLGKRAGQPTLRIVDPSATRPGETVAEVSGFNVHAGVVVDGRDRVRLERLYRYLGRPPIAQERLERLADGRVRYTMKKPWRDGPTALILEPLDLLARLCAMVPPAGFHMIRFHGVLAAHAAARAEVVPKVDPSAEPKTDAERAAAQLALFAEPDAGQERSPARKPWAWLLERVFAVDVTVCPACKGPMRWLEVATTPMRSRGSSRASGSALERPVRWRLAAGALGRASSSSTSAAETGRHGPRSASLGHPSIVAPLAVAPSCANLRPRSAPPRSKEREQLDVGADGILDVRLREEELGVAEDDREQSCAIPPASRPTASIFCACRSCSSVRCRASSARSRSARSSRAASRSRAHVIASAASSAKLRARSRSCSSNAGCSGRQRTSEITPSARPCEPTGRTIRLWIPIRSTGAPMLRHDVAAQLLGADVGNEVGLARVEHAADQGKECRRRLAQGSSYPSQRLRVRVEGGGGADPLAVARDEHDRAIVAEHRGATLRDHERQRLAVGRGRGEAADRIRQVARACAQGSYLVLGLERRPRWVHVVTVAESRGAPMPSERISDRRNTVEHQSATRGSGRQRTLPYPTRRIPQLNLRCGITDHDDRSWLALARPSIGSGARPRIALGAVPSAPPALAQWIVECFDVAETVDIVEALRARTADVLALGERDLPTQNRKVVRRFREVQRLLAKAVAA